MNCRNKKSDDPLTGSRSPLEVVRTGASLGNGEVTVIYEICQSDDDRVDSKSCLKATNGSSYKNKIAVNNEMVPQVKELDDNYTVDTFLYNSETTATVSNVLFVASVEDGLSVDANSTDNLVIQSGNSLNDSKAAMYVNHTDTITQSDADVHLERLEMSLNVDETTNFYETSSSEHTVLYTTLNAAGCSNFCTDVTTTSKGVTLIDDIHQDSLPTCLPSVCSINVVDVNRTPQVTTIASDRSHPFDKAGNGNMDHRDLKLLNVVDDIPTLRLCRSMVDDRLMWSTCDAVKQNSQTVKECLSANVNDIIEATSEQIKLYDSRQTLAQNDVKLKHLVQLVQNNDTNVSFGSLTSLQTL